MKKLLLIIIILAVLFAAAYVLSLYMIEDITVLLRQPINF